MNNAAERNEVSLHEVRVFLALKGKPEEWLTNLEISKASGVNQRTTRLHTIRLVQLGMLEKAEVFPAHRYRWSAKGARRNAAYSQRLQTAAEVFANQLGG